MRAPTEGRVRGAADIRSSLPRGWVAAFDLPGPHCGSGVAFLCFFLWPHKERMARQALGCKQRPARDSSG